MGETDALPHFRRAPITEFAISVQFQPLVAFTFVDIGPLRETFQSRFPKVEFRPTLVPQIEILTPSPPRRLQMLQIPLAGAIPLMWLLSEDGIKVMQFQSDRIVRNWRRKSGDAYPRYPSLRDEFFEDVGRLRAFLRDRSLGELSPVQCELTYVNRIPAAEGVTSFTARAFENWHEIQPAGLIAEDVAINQRFIFTDENKLPVGRIYFQSGPGVRDENSEAVQLLMFGRAVLSQPNLDGARRLLDRMHELIVRCFVDLTTPGIRAEWEQVG